MTNNRRDTLPDMIKTLCIIFVIAYHSMLVFSLGEWHGGFGDLVTFCTFCCDWMRFIHVQTFIAASGYLYANSFYNCGIGSTKTSIEKRVKRLLIPYAIVSLLWAIPFELFFDRTPLTQIFFHYFLGTSPAQLWYLLVQMNVYIFGLILINWIIKQGKIKKLLIYFGLTLVYVVATLISTRVINMFQLLSSVQFFVFYLLGFQLYRSRSIYSKKVSSVCFLLVYTALLFIKMYILENRGERIPQVLSTVLTPIVSIIGILLIFSLAYALVNYLSFRKIMNTGFVFICFLFHQQLIYISNGLIFFPWYLRILVNYVVATVGSYIIYLILERSMNLKKVFGLNK